MVHDMVSTIVEQFVDATETPADTDALDLGIAGRLHVDSRVANIYRLCACDAGIAQYVGHNRRA